MKMSDSLTQEDAAFQRKALLIVATVIGLGGGTAGVSAFFASDGGEEAIVNAIVAVVIVAISVAALVLGLTHRQVAGARLLILGNFALMALAAPMPQSPATETAQALVSFVILAAFLLSPRTALILGCIGFAAMLLGLGVHLVQGPVHGEFLEGRVSTAVHVLVTSVVVFLFSSRARGTLVRLGRQLAQNAVLFRRLPEASQRLSSAAGEISAMTRQQTAGATRQSAAMNETRETLHAISESSRRIVTSAGAVEADARKVADNSDKVAEDIRNLAGHTQNIEEILKAIKEVANRSDLLALNAALEGTKAGEMGHGFSLVATRMQRLAENILESVGDIKQITDNIQQATRATELSMAEMGNQAAANRESSRQIAMISQQQTNSIDEVAAAVDDVSDIAAQFAQGSQETASSTEELDNLTKDLDEIVSDFLAVGGDTGLSSDPDRPTPTRAASVVSRHPVAGTA